MEIILPRISIAAFWTVTESTEIQNALVQAEGEVEEVWVAVQFPKSYKAPDGSSTGNHCALCHENNVGERKSTWSFGHQYVLPNLYKKGTRQYSNCWGVSLRRTAY